MLAGGVVAALADPTGAARGRTYGPYLHRNVYHTGRTFAVGGHIAFWPSYSSNWFASAQVLLGVGWNFLYVGGTNLLIRSYSTAEKGKVQAANDLNIFVVGLLASPSAGALHSAIG